MLCKATDSWYNVATESCLHDILLNHDKMGTCKVIDMCYRTQNSELRQVFIQPLNYKMISK